MPNETLQKGLNSDRTNPYAPSTDSNVLVVQAQDVSPENLRQEIRPVVTRSTHEELMGILNSNSSIERKAEEITWVAKMGSVGREAQVAQVNLALRERGEALMRSGDLTDLKELNKLIDTLEKGKYLNTHDVGGHTHHRGDLERQIDDAIKNLEKQAVYDAKEARETQKQAEREAREAAERARQEQASREQDRQVSEKDNHPSMLELRRVRGERENFYKGSDRKKELNDRDSSGLSKVRDRAELDEHLYRERFSREIEFSRERLKALEQLKGPAEHNPLIAKTIEGERKEIATQLAKAYNDYVFAAKVDIDQRHAWLSDGRKRADAYLETLKIEMQDAINNPIGSEADAILAKLQSRPTR